MQRKAITLFSKRHLGVGRVRHRRVRVRRVIQEPPPAVAVLPLDLLPYPPQSTLNLLEELFRLGCQPIGTVGVGLAAAVVLVVARRPREVCVFAVQPHDVGSAAAADVGCSMTRASLDRADVLARSRLDGIFVGRHIARATTASSNDRRLQGRSLEVRGLNFGRFGRVGDVTGAASTGGCHVSRHLGKYLSERLGY